MCRKAKEAEQTERKEAASWRLVGWMVIFFSASIVEQYNMIFYSAVRFVDPLPFFLSFPHVSFIGMYL